MNFPSYPEKCILQHFRIDQFFLASILETGKPAKKYMSLAVAYRCVSVQQLSVKSPL
jgi:hypothetical protein